MFYVYTYTDPRNNQIFYVGKGSGGRMHAHLKPSLWGDPKNTPNPYLYYKIKGMMEQDIVPEINMVYESESEDDVYNHEHKLILELGTFNEGGPLKNISTYKGGNKKGISFNWSDERLEKHQKRCKQNRKWDPSKQELLELYIDKNYRMIDIANMFGVSAPLVKQRLRDHGITKPKKLSDKAKERKVTAKCEHCGEKFDKKRSSKVKYCSQVCSQKSRLTPVYFKGIMYESKYDAQKKTGYSLGYIVNCKGD